VGLDAFVDQVLPPGPPAVLDLRTDAERAVTHLTDVSVVTAITAGLPLSDDEFERALHLASQAGRSIVTIDLRHVDQLSPAQILALAEHSAELHHDIRTLIIVNATTVVAAQLRKAGLSGGLRMSIDDQR
jgi:anti-anti-sigma regulatory factor